MYRLLIVDDEEIITDGLYGVFHRLMPEKLDVYRAYSGKEALEWMSRTRIDIVLTDIAMPGMNGIEMTEQIQSYWPRCKIVFLTGHSEFEYAYRALQMTDVRYLLKTEGYDKVTETVSAVIEEIERSHSANELLEQSREQRQAFELMAQGDYLRQVIRDSNALCVNRESLEQDFNKLKIGFEPDRPVVLTLGRLKYPADATYTEKGDMLASTRTIWDSYFKDHTNSIGIVDKHGDMLWFIQPSEPLKAKFGEQWIRYLEGMLELVQEGGRASLGIQIGFTIGGSCGWEFVTTQYERLRQLQRLMIGDGESVILRDPEHSVHPSPVKDELDRRQKLEYLSSYLESGKPSEFFEIFDELTSCRLQGCGALQVTTETYYSIALLLFTYCNRWGASGAIEEYGKLLRLDEHASMKEGFLYVRQAAESIFSMKCNDERDRASRAIDQICRYIEEHVSEDLSLVRLAEPFYFNPSYLSRFFKQERGINLSEFIDLCRVKKAKELLNDGEYKIREVGMAVGYDAAPSFTRFFKKVTGMTPQEYRDTLPGNELT
ncbi:response regulator [Paenibacillus sp. TRM 82003]|nr:response regulator [Paenibacillus sp. TRM 82003]